MVLLKAVVGFTIKEFLYCLVKWNWEYFSYSFILVQDINSNIINANYWIQIRCYCVFEKVYLKEFGKDIQLFQISKFTFIIEWVSSIGFWHIFFYFPQKDVVKQSSCLTLRKRLKILFSLVYLCSIIFIVFIIYFYSHDSLCQIRIWKILKFILWILFCLFFINLLICR